MAIGRASRLWATALLFGALASCGEFPRDAFDTLDKARASGTIRAGYAVAEPWVRAGPSGIEPALVEAWARAEGLRVEWRRASQSQLAQALRRHELAIAVGGFEAGGPWAGRVATTRPYRKDGTRVIALAPAENALALSLDRFLADRAQAGAPE